MDLVRLMLLRTEAIGVSKEDADKYHAQCLKYPEPVRAHQIAIMIEAGLIIGLASASPESGGLPVKGAIGRLTWQGHEFLDAARNDTRWRKAKAAFTKRAVGLTFSLLTEYLKMEGKKLVFGATSE